MRSKTSMPAASVFPAFLSFRFFDGPTPCAKPPEERTDATEGPGFGPSCIKTFLRTGSPALPQSLPCASRFYSVFPAGSCRLAFMLSSLLTVCRPGIFQFPFTKKPGKCPASAAFFIGCRDVKPGFSPSVRSFRPVPRPSAQLSRQSLKSKAGQTPGLCRVFYWMPSILGMPLKPCSISSSVRSLSVMVPLL